MKQFEGKKIRDQILAKVGAKIDKMERKTSLAVICVGENPICSKYVGLKKKVADRIGVNFIDLYFDATNTQKDIIAKIESLNSDENIDGIMIQMPIPDKFDKFEVVHAIAPEKDVDGLRFCCNYLSKFKPPVVLAILEAIKLSLVCHSGLDPESTESNTILDPRLRGDDKRESDDDIDIVDCLKDKKIVLIGEGFLVGGPLKCYFKEQNIEVQSINNINNSTIQQLKSADILISAVGKHGIIHPDMIKDGVVLIDAGTTEVSGELKGDIDPACYEKASFYTPVPGGIGPVTIAKLFENLVK